MTKDREAPGIDLQPELEEKSAALDARLRAMEAATPPPAAQGEPKTQAEKAAAVNAVVHPKAKKSK